MDRNCGIEGCERPAEFCCDCANNNYLCVEHVGIHIKKIGAHHGFVPLSIYVEDYLKEKLIEGINDKFALIANIKSEITNSCKDIIQYTTNKCQQAIEELNDKEKHYNLLKETLIEKNEINMSDHQQGLLLADQMIGAAANLNLIKRDIDIYLEQRTSILDTGYDEDCF